LGIPPKLSTVFSNVLAIDTTRQHIEPGRGYPPPWPDLRGKSALVTGAAGAIGGACVRDLVTAGARVVAVDADSDGLVALATSTGCTPAVCDLSDPRALAELPPADILVNNAGFQRVAPIEDFPDDIFEKMLAVMVTAAFRLIKMSLPHMREAGWGRIINVSSIHGHRASPYKAGYVAAKHALEGLTKVTALEAGGSGVTANSISPAYVRTPLVLDQVSAQANTRGLSEAEVHDSVFLAKTAVKRLIEPQEVTGVCLFLCSPQADFINGTSMHIDGGWTAQ